MVVRVPFELSCLRHGDAPRNADGRRGVAQGHNGSDRSFPVLQGPRDEEHPRKVLLSPRGETFGLEFIEAFFHPGNFPVNELSGPFGTTTCLVCGAELEEDRTRKGTVSGEIRIDGMPGFRTTVTGPVLTCNRCEHEQLLFSRHDDSAFAEAMLELFQDGGIDV